MPIIGSFRNHGSDRRVVRVQSQPTASIRSLSVNEAVVAVGTSEGEVYLCDHGGKVQVGPPRSLGGAAEGGCSACGHEPKEVAAAGGGHVEIVLSSAADAIPKSPAETEMALSIHAA